MSNQLLIYHNDAQLYHAILTRKLPRLKIRSATRPEEAREVIEEAEILLTWSVPGKGKTPAMVCLAWCRE